ncbi:MAG: alpha-L-fucosidase [Oscillospiraceae bacterium]|jgi:alpha-L-fucosidase|nr:alpha-L-fucosidase [Oscillospiraceae bacterium]
MEALIKDLIPRIFSLLIGGIMGILSFFAPNTYLSETAFAGRAWFDKAPSENAAVKLGVLPTERQLLQAENDVYAFFHFGMNTYTDTELGTGKEDPALFNPTALDTDQWVKTVADAGFTGAIITAKHHDGFCLWPSAYTEHSVKNSGYNGDVVGEFAASCRKYGIKFGVYLSPFDENAENFGQGDAYNDYYVAQLTELLTNYGEVFEVWWDGFITDEYKGKQTYDWNRWIATVRQYQPDASTAIGPPEPDVAWVGNESGSSGGNVSSVRYRNNKWIWARSECDTSIHNGWFYHENESPLSLKRLKEIYYDSVAQNCGLLLNIPPSPAGGIDARDIQRIAEFGDFVRSVTAHPLTPTSITVRGKDADRARAIPQVITDDSTAVPFADDEYIVDIQLDSVQKIEHMVIREDVKNTGERIEHYTLYALYGGKYVQVGEGRAASNKGILKLPTKIFPIKSDRYRLVIDQAKAAPSLKFLGFYG